jgi:hypothetical protein
MTGNSGLMNIWNRIVQVNAQKLQLRHDFLLWEVWKRCTGEVP